MIAIEPPRTQYDLNFTLAGVPVRIHPMFWLMGALLGRPFDSPPQVLLIWMLVVLVSILAHEFGHVIAFRYFGVPAHVVLYSFGGLAVPGGYRQLSRGQHIVVSLAGPAAGFVVAAGVIAALLASGAPLSFELGGPMVLVDLQPYQPFNLFLAATFMLYLNIWWGLMNLLPVFPLDGGQVARQVLSQHDEIDGTRKSLMVSIVVAVGVALIAAVQWKMLFVALLFGYLAYINYDMLQKLQGRGSGW